MECNTDREWIKRNIKILLQYKYKNFWRLKFTIAELSVKNHLRDDDKLNFNKRCITEQVLGESAASQLQIYVDKLAVELFS